MKPGWAWLRDDANRGILGMIGAALVAIVAAVWAVFTFVVDKHDSPNVHAESGGFAAGHDISGNTIGAPAGSPKP